MNDFCVKTPEEQIDLFGHDDAQKILLDLWNKGRLTGSWLFCGPRGIGKATLAYRLARFVLAQPSETSGDNLFGKPEPPDSLFISENHPVFKSVAQRMNPGLKVIECGLKEEEIKSRQALIDAGKPLDPETERNRRRFDEIRITDVREAETFLHLTAGANGWRIVIIDSADDMNSNAANALLKSLEEPPDNTLIILISHVPGKLLPTIRSRCRKLSLKPLENKCLEDIFKAKYNHISDQDCHSLALLSEGSPGKALALTDHDGLHVFKQMLALFSDFPELSVSKVYDFVEKTLKDKELLKTAQVLLIQWLAGVCISAEKTDEEEIFPSEALLRKRLQDTIPVLKLMDLTDELQKAFADIDLDQKQVFINAFLTLQREAG